MASHSGSQGSTSASGSTSHEITHHKESTLRSRGTQPVDTVGLELDTPQQHVIESYPFEVAAYNSEPPPAAKWFTIAPYPYEPPATRGDNGTCCGDCPGNAAGLLIAGVEWIYEKCLVLCNRPRYKKKASNIDEMS